MPVWLHYVQGTVFRTDSEPFKVCKFPSLFKWIGTQLFHFNSSSLSILHPFSIANIAQLLFPYNWILYLGLQYYMQKFMTYIVNLMKQEKLFASQGGPIILAQASKTFSVGSILLKSNWKFQLVSFIRSYSNHISFDMFWKYMHWYLKGHLIEDSY